MENAFPDTNVWCCWKAPRVTKSSRFHEFLGQDPVQRRKGGPSKYFTVIHFLLDLSEALRMFHVKPKWRNDKKSIKCQVTVLHRSEYDYKNPRSSHGTCSATFSCKCSKVTFSGWILSPRLTGFPTCPANTQDPQQKEHQQPADHQPAKPCTAHCNKCNPKWKNYEHVLLAKEKNNKNTFLEKNKKTWKTTENNRRFRPVFCKRREKVPQEVQHGCDVGPGHQRWRWSSWSASLHGSGNGVTRPLFWLEIELKT